MKNKCKNCGNTIGTDNKYCDKCGSPVNKLESRKNKIYLILGIIIVIILILVSSFYIYNELNPPTIVVPNWFNLESNESGVETYVDSGNPNLRIEIKDEGNDGGLTDYNNYDVAILRTFADGKNKIITIYMVKQNIGTNLISISHTGKTDHELQSERIFNHMIKDGHLSNNLGDVVYIK